MEYLDQKPDSWDHFSKRIGAEIKEIFSKDLIFQYVEHDVTLGFMKNLSLLNSIPDIKV